MHKKSRFLFVGSVCLSLCASLCHAQDLEAALASALDHHPSIIGAQAGVNAAEYGRDAAVSGYYPEVSVSATGGRIYQDNSTSRGLVNERGAAYSGYGDGHISMRQMVFDGMETQNKVDAAQAREDSRKYALMDMKEQITLRVAQSYIDILRIRGALDILAQQAKNIGDYEARIAEMVVDGVADEAEMQQARDVSMIIENVRAEYDGQLIAARAAYAEVVGEMPSDLMPVPKSLYTYIDGNIDDVVNKAVENHPLLQSARMDSRAARNDMKAVQGQAYPDIAGELSYSKNDKKDVIGGESKDMRAVVHVNWGFSTGGKELATLRQKRYEHYELAAKRDEVAGQVKRDIYGAYATYRTFQRKLEISEGRVDLNEKLLSAYEAQFEGSRINLLGLMKAESQLFGARLDLNDNVYNCLIAEYSVLAAMGMLKDNILMAQGDLGD